MMLRIVKDKSEGDWSYTTASAISNNLKRLFRVTS
jgi:hypothetical protein